MAEEWIEPRGLPDEAFRALRKECPKACRRGPATIVQLLATPSSNAWRRDVDARGDCGVLFTDNRGLHSARTQRECFALRYFLPRGCASYEHLEAEAALCTVSPQCGCLALG